MDHALPVAARLAVHLADLVNKTTPANTTPKNYDWSAADPHLSPGGMIAVIWVETALAILFVLLRAAIRLRTLRGKFGLDDYLVFFGLIMLIIQTALYTPVVSILYLFLAVEAEVTAPPQNFVTLANTYLRYEFVLIISFWTCLWSIKLSFLVFYRRLFDGTTHRWKIIAWWVVVVISILSYIGCIITQLLVCQPLRSYFQVGECNTPLDIYNTDTSLYYAFALDIATDLMIMALPLSILPALVVDKRRKIALMGVFGVGFIIIAFAVVRLIRTHPDNTHINLEWLCVMTITEVSVAVMVSCAPAFRSLYAERANKSYPSRSSRQKGSSHTTESVERLANTTGDSMHGMEMKNISSTKSEQLEDEVDYQE